VLLSGDYAGELEGMLMEKERSPDQEKPRVSRLPNRQLTL